MPCSTPGSPHSADHEQQKSRVEDPPTKYNERPAFDPHIGGARFYIGNQMETPLDAQSRSLRDFGGLNSRLATLCL